MRLSTVQGPFRGAGFWGCQLKLQKQYNAGNITLTDAETPITSIEKSENQVTCLRLFEVKASAGQKTVVGDSYASVFVN